jgi:hypothetical protein
MFTSLLFLFLYLQQPINNTIKASNPTKHSAQHASTSYTYMRCRREDSRILLYETILFLAYPELRFYLYSALTLGSTAQYPVMSDTYKLFGQYMQRKSCNKFQGVKCHCFFDAGLPIIFITESYPVIRYV